MDKEMTILDKLLDDNNKDNIILATQEGENTELEQIGVVGGEDGLYAILHPVSLPPEQVVVFKVSDEDEDCLELVQDETLAKQLIKELTQQNEDADTDENDADVQEAEKKLEEVAEKYINDETDTKTKGDKK